MMDWDPIGTAALDVSHGNGHRPSRASDEVTIPYPDREEKIKLLLRSLLVLLGEDPERSGLRGTPQRMARMYGELLAGYETDIETLVNGALFDVDYSEMVVVKDIEYYSLCEHHLLPFFGKAHVAYIPRDRVIGLSKIPRIVEMYARRLQVQERMTQQIATQLDDVLHPQGVAVVMEGTHLCAAMRGVEQRSARMRTSAMLGCFQKNAALRAEFLQQIGPEPAH
ncbi:MAG TPA: GTP cyclohydrolase I FolE [Hyphomicrobiaceae bacterium]|nr:GTP cyclohydrolase I FolE [Hyphomicrobiaceae bacterium]